MTTPSDAHTSPGRAWSRLLFLLAPATLIMAVDRAIVTVTAPVLRPAYGMSLSQLGMIFSVFFWAYAAMQIPAGLLVQRMGSRFALMIALILWSAMTILTPYAGSFALLLVVRVLLGIGQSADWPAAIVGVRHLFGAEHRPRANAILLCALYLGPVLGAPLATHLLTAFGLRAAFVIPGVAGLLFAAVWWFGYADGFSPSESEAARPSILSTLTLSLRDVLPKAWPLALAYACTGFLLAFYLSLFPTYMVEVRHLTLQLTGFYSALSSGSLCVAVLATGQHLAKRAGAPRATAAMRASVASGALVIGGAGTYLVFFLQDNAGMLLAACVALAAIGVCQVVTWSTVQDLGSKDSGMMTGVVSLSGNLASGAAPYLCASTAERTGSWMASFLALGVIGVVGAVLWVFVRPRRAATEKAGLLS